MESLQSRLRDVISIRIIFTARKRSLGQGNIFTPVCHSVHRGGACVVAPGGACVVLFGGCVVLFKGVRGFIWGGAWFYLGGAWFYSGGVHGFIRGACVVLFRGRAWFYLGGVHGFFSFSGYNEIRSMSGRYASYWNAFLFTLLSNQ